MKYEIGRLTLEVNEKSDPVTVVWKGESDAREPAKLLQPHLDALLSQLASKAVCMKFDALDYMNSSTVKPIMVFLEELSKVATSIRVEYRESLQWQATSFRAMRIVAKRKWGNVEIVGLG